MNYTQLQAAVARKIGRKDLSAEIADAVGYCHSELNMRLRIAELETTVVLVGTDGVYALPTDYSEAIRVRIGTTTIPRANATTSDNYINSPQTYYTVGDELIINDAPDADADVTLVYYKKLEVLVGDTDTNEVLTNYPLLYVYGTTTHLHIMVQDLELGTADNDRYTSLIETLNKQAARRRGAPRLTTNYNIGQNYGSAL